MDQFERPTGQDRAQKDARKNQKNDNRREKLKLGKNMFQSRQLLGWQTKHRSMENTEEFKEKLKWRTMF